MRSSGGTSIWLLPQKASKSGDISNVSSGHQRPECADVEGLANRVAANSRDLTGAAGTMRLQLRVLNASTVADTDAAFAAFANELPDALLISQERPVLHYPARPIGPAYDTIQSPLDLWLVLLSRSRRADELRHRSRARRRGCKTVRYRRRNGSPKARGAVCLPANPPTASSARR